MCHINLVVNLTGKELDFLISHTLEYLKIVGLFLIMSK